MASIFFIARRQHTIVVPVFWACPFMMPPCPYRQKAPHTVTLARLARAGNQADANLYR
ncbi:hypothetical protein ApDm4_2694 [Acetobacter pomorum]|nr:hypothetical protein ApDm4_2694 [Acetobacter pomorum]